MLDQIITLAVDATGTQTTFVDEEFKRHSVQNDSRSTYKGSDSTHLKRNYLQANRVEPTKSGNFPGMVKSGVKLTQDLEVAGVDTTTSLVAPHIFHLTRSCPVGASEADFLHLLGRLQALVKDVPLMKAIFLDQSI